MSLFSEPTAKVEPRDYQLAAFKSVQTFLEYREGNPCVVLPTGAGKTILIVLLCQWVESWGGRVLILAHVKELLQQAADSLKIYGVDCGVFSAGLERKEKDFAITVAGIHSIYLRAGEFEVWDLIVIDEAHLIPPDGEGMYRTFLTDARKRNPKLRLVGLTATPFRLSSGMLCGEENLLRSVCYEASVMDLIQRGFLCPLVSKRAASCDTSELHIRAGEFVAQEVELLINTADVVKNAVFTLLQKSKDRRSILVFCASVDHAQRVQTEISTQTGILAEIVTGETESDERKKAIGDFRAGVVRFLVNVNVLTTGFDAPNVDCVAILRPTNSPGLYVQICGRGLRIADGKKDCLILDFGGNIQRHGPINAIKPKQKFKTKGEGSGALTKVCPECDEVVFLGVRTCPVCSYEWAKTDPDLKLEESDILADAETSVVLDVAFFRHVKRGAPPDHPPTLRVDYKISWREWISEWVCIEHEGFAKTRAQLWWQARSADPFPKSVEQALDIAAGGGLATALRVSHKPDGKYVRIVAVELGPKPEPAARCSECEGRGCEVCGFDFRSVTPSEELAETEWGEVPF